MLKFRSGLLVAFAMLSLTSATVSAQAETGVEATEDDGPEFDPMASHLVLGAHIAAAGEIDSDGPFSGRMLDVTAGAFVRFDLPVWKYLALAPSLSGGAWTFDGLAGNDIGRSGYIDVDLMTRIRYPTSSQGFLADIYLGVPVGYSAFLLNDDLGPLGDVEHGWNIGAVVGAQLQFTDLIGIVVELGWLRHAMHSTPSTVSFQQLVIDIGLSIQLGG